MIIHYAVSAWSYWHHAHIGHLEAEVERARALGFGIELWNRFGRSENLFASENLQHLRPALQDMEVSLHSAIVHSFNEHARQIDTARALGADVIVLHSDDLCKVAGAALDPGLTRDVVGYAAERGIRLALENGQLPVLVEALETVDGLGVCLDVGHVYATSEPLSVFLGHLKNHLIHIHLQDILSPPERRIARAPRDHYLPGSGGIPQEDWSVLAATLREIDYEGMAVFEVRPRHPLQAAVLGSGFLQSFLEP